MATCGQDVTIETCFDNPGEWQELTFDVKYDQKWKSELWINDVLSFSFVTPVPSWWHRFWTRALLGWRWEVIGDDR